MVDNGVRHWQVTAEEAGQRLDNFLLRVLKGVPRSHIYKILRSGEVRVNKGRARPHYHLHLGDVLRLPPVRSADPAAVPRLPEQLAVDLRERVLFEDDRVLVLDKPAGMAVHGGSGIRYGVIEALRQLRPDLRELELVHRLDRDTSGCLLLSKRRSALRSLHQALREEAMDKRYLALVGGRWKGAERVVKLPLRKNTLQSGERIVRVDEDQGKPARTRFYREEDLGIATLLRAELDTGRTHQIRVHLQAIGHPTAGDSKYGDETFNGAMRALGLRRLFLHAAFLAFPHPRDERIVRVEAPLPADLDAVLQRLRVAEP
ncbi:MULTISPECIES: 23S rRNA pseudouridine(955/2504/2580) synthase RluC [Acidithiobacillus]|uniref:23S rRNA pseudouridine(955/2504/2580) synthase RluC n=1 Tax=Acidithiobacillus TaxID=119977 RepID=UPI001C073E40|nr:MULTISPECIES: 23S rRNA pseudouridine(955/2504/2580) synthase RluC [Acidithiobacillus]MBU2763201.1 23S rRNA pseudouridine(955/2504/2580) synthase RluC [Acidithiobacillus caldus]MBU2770871.1 23S rRNA pseudouridine(955/2504/2580) synthase RluC [Acidithiobacillus caldus]MBU2791082.1 23S rRNA pseudouridine(955/2504/2580) synthase RluC [Acidithiobacillus caldus]MBU2800923.1 23S rRNA pseudouridine(955/2504/2580) synthase RluC [Acidithiobacillus caldus]MBU2819929.1 23S rRNA pseudouridine(955/2504/2